MKKADPVLARLQGEIEDHAVQVSLRVHNDFAHAKRASVTRHNQWADRLEAERTERRLRALERFQVDVERAKRDPEYAKRKNDELNTLLRIRARARARTEPL